jgi:MFS family permease
MIRPRRPSSSFAAFAGVFTVTLLGLTAVGATLPVLPRYVKGPLESGDVAVGVVVGAFAITGLAFRPIAGRLADTRGRRVIVASGALIAASAGLLYLIPAGVPGLIFARLVLGIGEGMVFTAGSAWVVDLAPPERRGRVIGLYGLSIWTGLSLGPAVGEALYGAAGFDVVWLFAAAAPLVSAMVALRIPDPFTPSPTAERGPWIAREAIQPGLGLAMASVGFAAVASFIVLHLAQRGESEGAVAFTAFAATVVLARLLAGDLPDRIGPLRCAAGAALVESAGLALIALSHDLTLAIAGSITMGAAFSLLYPSLSLIVINKVGVDRRGSALGTFTACFDLGFAIGGPLTGAAAALGGYPAAFAVGSAAALGTASIVLFALRPSGRRASAAPAPGLEAPPDAIP